MTPSTDMLMTVVVETFGSFPTNETDGAVLHACAGGAVGFHIAQRALGGGLYPGVSSALNGALVMLIGIRVGIVSPFDCGISKLQSWMF